MSALEALGLTTQRVFGVACEFQCEHPVAVKDTAVATHLYRIAQEAVTNAIRHGETSRIVLELTAARDRGVLTVENNGRDFPVERPAGEGMGLQVMHYRAQMIGGLLDVGPAPAGGTRVTCAFDLATETSQGEN
jgi:signal transduction histidine kinase